MEERIIDDEYGRGVRLKKTKDGYVDVTDELAENTDTEEIFLFVLCMRIAFCNTEGEKRHGQSSDHSGPHYIRKKHIARMVKHHTDHGNYFQCCSVQYLIFFHAVHLLSHSFR